MSTSSQGTRRWSNCWLPCLSSAHSPPMHGRRIANLGVALCHVHRRRVAPAHLH